jgi:hypothetical protein
MAYWNSKFGNLPAPRPPKRLCGYYVTPMFAFRWDQAPKDMAELIGWIPFTMQTQTGSLATTLALKHSTNLPEADLPGGPLALPTRAYPRDLRAGLDGGAVRRAARRRQPGFPRAPALRMSKMAFKHRMVTRA